jgi:hypothetical protein
MSFEFYSHKRKKSVSRFVCIAWRRLGTSGGQSCVIVQCPVCRSPGSVDIFGHVYTTHVHISQMFNRVNSTLIAHL